MIKKLAILIVASVPTFSFSVTPKELLLVSLEHAETFGKFKTLCTKFDLEQERDSSFEQRYETLQEIVKEYTLWRATNSFLIQHGIRTP